MPENMDKEEQKRIKQRLKEEAEKAKMEIAEELGLADKVRQCGWRSLTSSESGRIGGLMRKKRRDGEN